MKIYRQGDVLIMSCKKPEGALDPVPAEGDRSVLAHGEATGHTHSVAAKIATLYARAKTAERYLEVTQPTELLHQEHAPIPLERGWYRVIRQREYAPSEIRYVAD